MLVCAADELITAWSECATCDQWAVGAVGLVQRAERRVGRLAIQAQQAKQGYKSFRLTEYQTGERHSYQEGITERTEALEPAGC